MRNILRKVVLWDTRYEENAYKDQFGFSHPGYIVDNEFIVTIVDEQYVGGMFGDGIYEGWKAVTNDGMVFTCNWNIFPNDSATPTYYWDARRDGEHIWKPVDAHQASKFMPHFDKDGNLKVPPEV